MRLLSFDTAGLLHDMVTSFIIQLLLETVSEFIGHLQIYKTEPDRSIYWQGT